MQRRVKRNGTILSERVAKSSCSGDMQLNRDLKEMRYDPWHSLGQNIFYRGASSAKVLRQGHVWQGKGAARQQRDWSGMRQGWAVSEANREAAMD